MESQVSLDRLDRAESTTVGARLASLSGFRGRVAGSGCAPFDVLLLAVRALQSYLLSLEVVQNITFKA